MSEINKEITFLSPYRFLREGRGSGNGLQRESVEASSTSEDSIRCLFSLSSWALMIKLSLKTPRLKIQL